MHTHEYTLALGTHAKTRGYLHKDGSQQNSVGGVSAQAL